MQHGGQLKNIAGALAKAQAGIESPPRNREVKVQTKTGGSYKFRYATLDAIIDAVRGPLTENGLWFVQALDFTPDGKIRLVTTLTHESGEWIRSEHPVIVQEQGNQAFGSALTYARRYALTTMLGVSADEDDDANSAEGNSAEVVSDRKPKAAGKKAPDKGAPAEIVTWAKGMADRIGEAETVAVLAELDVEISEKKDLRDVTRTHLKERIETRRGFLSQAPAQEAAE